MGTAKYAIEYAPEIKGHLKAIDRKYWSLIRDKIEEQLSVSPHSETRNRKPLKKPPRDDRWEIRFGPENIFRVIYKVQTDPRKVLILAIGEKRNEWLFIAGKEM